MDVCGDYERTESGGSCRALLRSLILSHCGQAKLLRGNEEERIPVADKTEQVVSSLQEHLSQNRKGTTYFLSTPNRTVCSNTAREERVK
jgi:hypothetical protein